MNTYANNKQERYNMLRSAAERALTGWPATPPDEEGVFGRTPEKIDPVPAVNVPKSPRVASRTMPGTTPMKVKGF